MNKLNLLIVITFIICFIVNFLILEIKYKDFFKKEFITELDHQVCLGNIPVDGADNIKFSLGIKNSPTKCIVFYGAKNEK